MSSSFKVVIALIALGAIISVYLGVQSETEMSAITSPHQSLEELKATGHIEVKSFKTWQMKHKGEGAQFKRWRERLLQDKQPSSNGSSSTSDMGESSD